MLNLYKYPTVGINDKLTVSTTVSVMGYFLPTPISRFKHSPPNVEVNLIEQSRVQLEKAILQGDADIGIAITSNVDDDRFSTETLFQSGRSLWCSAMHPFANLDEVSLQQICEQPYRSDAEIHNMTVSAMAMQPDLVWACELADYLRGRKSGEVSKLIATAVSGTGCRSYYPTA